MHTHSVVCKRLAVRLVALIAVLPVIAWLGIPHLASAEHARQTQGCATVESPSEIPAPGVIDFDDLRQATVIGDSYRPAYGVRFEDLPTNKGMIHAMEPRNAHSPPNFAINYDPPCCRSPYIPMRIYFDSGKRYIGMYNIGNPYADVGELRAYDEEGDTICQKLFRASATIFIGFFDRDDRIASLSLDYGASYGLEAIDDLYFGPYDPALTPTATLSPTHTPTQRSTPTVSDTPVPTSTPTAIDTPVPTSTPTSTATSMATSTPNSTPRLSPTPPGPQPPSEIPEPATFLMLLSGLAGLVGYARRRSFAMRRAPARPDESDGSES